jgi:Beta-lactamase
MHDVLAGYVERSEVPGMGTLVSRRGEVHVDAIGSKVAGGDRPMDRDSIFRISSMTKPITAAATMIPIEDCRLVRAIRAGIGHDERTIFPIMPYRIYQKISDDQVAAVVVYIRSLPAVQNPLPPTRINFPVNYLVRGVPEPVTKPVHGPTLLTPWREAGTW